MSETTENPYDFLLEKRDRLADRPQTSANIRELQTVDAQFEKLAALDDRTKASLVRQPPPTSTRVSPPPPSLTPVIVPALASTGTLARPKSSTR
jgi:hypothetical protein